MTRAESGPQLRLYGRTDCHLCDELAAQLAILQSEFRFQVRKIDIEADPDLRARFGLRIPVLVDSAGKEWCAGRCEEAVLRRHLALECPAR